MGANNINDKFANQALIAGYNYILQTAFYQNPLLLTNDNVPFERWDMQESYFGESDEQYNLNNWYYALLYAYLFWKQVVIYGQTLYNTSVSLDYCQVKDCFACKGISLDAFLGFFGIVVPININGQIPTLNSNIGIGNINIEEEFIVQPNVIDTPSIPVTNGIESILNSAGCVWFIPNLNVNIPQCL